MKRLGPIIFSLIALGCSQPEKNDAEAVRALALGIIDADNRSDIKGVMSFYHPQAILFPPGRPKIEGLAAIEKNYRDILPPQNCFSKSPSKKLESRANGLWL